MTPHTRRGRAAAVLASLMLAAPSIPAPAQAGAAPSRPAPAHGAHGASVAKTPFARVYLALRGCTSCSHCRTTIRQMARSGAKGAEASVSGDQVEVRYPKPRSVPLRDVIQSLAKNRLHDMTVVDVLFEATGTIAVSGKGQGRFVLSETGQTFPIQVPETLHRPNGKPVRVVALVDGWRGKGGISLVAREVREA